MMLGAWHKPTGLDVAVLAPAAKTLMLCRVDPTSGAILSRLPMHETEGVWAIKGLDWEPGTFYGFCTDCNRGSLGAFSSRLILDPLARWVMTHHLHRYLAQTVLDLPPARTFIRSEMAPRLIYELHPKGFSKLNPAVNPTLRGSIEALAEASSIDYLRSLGVTTLCLMPISLHDDEPRLKQLGLSNYWGYNVLAWNAPHAPYLAAVRRLEPINAWEQGRLSLRHTIDMLHREGFEVILDVVYNHSAELDDEGPGYHFRLLDDQFYYRRDNQGTLENWSGCGNTLNFADQRSWQWLIQSLRQWVIEFGIDGFRFDLASSLLRSDSGDLPCAPSKGLWAAIQSDPILMHCLLIAEPWDLGPQGYRLGDFGPGVLEWNDRFRDGLRKFWITSSVPIAELADCLAGSSAVFQANKGSPAASINYLASHDGFSLWDLLCYSTRHNLLNAEGNRDGHPFEHAFNHGFEGLGDDLEIDALRRRKRSAMLCCLYASLGSLMIHSGDEWGRSQAGNNNAYCQDNELAWLRWQERDDQTLCLVRRLMSLRNQFASLLASQSWWKPPQGSFASRHSQDEQVVMQQVEAGWYRADGSVVSSDHWHDDSVRSFSLWLCMRQSLLVLINAQGQSIQFTLPGDAQMRWHVLIESSDPNSWEVGAGKTHRIVSANISLAAWSVVWLTPSLIS
ncbi:MAG: hypothetical protein EBT36_11145 [Betaproteobacteria bacterium]|jgi:glycogen operon protein|nr:hypothetical protein [Betaproteobacteria bacterium]NBS39735.1 hypothetical protein [Betaproteobacteria bacterium]NBT71925.1 hypothetical protein [Betaproteobacteria bacterium]NBT82152.1 hypothetical protein [Betaproteobacteria bacterium]NBY55475.1 hypothetical protein [Betaproteobacteria bacterium]